MSLLAIATGGVMGLAALGPCLLALRNLRAFAPPPEPPPGGEPPRVSVLIPARDEAAGIGAAVHAALASTGADVEVVVLDDQSRDGTPERVLEIAAADRQDRREARVRLLSGVPLPAGWSGKMHACRQLAAAARHPILLFVDADVRLAPDGVARAAALLADGAAGPGLVSGFPHQETVTFLERLLLPLMHFLLLGFLPFDRMRTSRHPAYGTGCGQLLLARRDAYDAAGGHAAIRACLHDGLALPRAFRRAGFATDLFDATPLATCRMYRDAGEVWRGLLKNTLEGLGAPRALFPATLLLVAGQILPPALLLVAALAAAGLPLPRPPLPLLLAAAVATLAAYLPRLVAVRRFRQPLDGALLHPLGIGLLLVIQWQGLLRWLLRRPAEWKGRAYATRSGGGGDQL